MVIYSDFNGANIKITATDGNTAYLDSDMRDSSGDWFYWAFAAEGAVGETVCFKFPKNRIGYFGPAVSYDLENWEWLGENGDKEEFSYTFNKDGRVYFAHHILYPEHRIYDLTAKHGIEKKTLCTSRRKRSVPFFKMGSGERKIMLTARHHACESTGSYVLEGVVSALLENPIPNTTLLVIPFVDYDGYVDGDQGKNRIPYDHNRDYEPTKEAIHPECAVIRSLAEAEGVKYAFDFHSPWHKGDGNDYSFIVRKTDAEGLKHFGRLLSGSLTDLAFKYTHERDIAPGVDWNNPSAPTYARFMLEAVKAEIAFTLETAYFGTKDNVASAEGFVELGRCFATALRKYMED